MEVFFNLLVPILTTGEKFEDDSHINGGLRRFIIKHKLRHCGFHCGPSVGLFLDHVNSSSNPKYTSIYTKLRKMVAKVCGLNISWKAGMHNIHI